MNFEFTTAQRIIFKRGAIKEVPSIASGMGKRTLLVTGSNEERYSFLIEQLKSSGIEVINFKVSGEPTVDIVLTGVNLSKEEKCDFIIGIGGGSVIDTGKAIAALLTNEGDPMDYLEVVGKGMNLKKASAPYIAIPTTAGTGSEVTKNAVLSIPSHRVKVSLRSQLMLPFIALIDSELTVSLPPHITATTGFDAITQLIEPYVCNNPNPLTDAICKEGIKRSARSLKRAFIKGHDIEAREDMCIASMFGGMALANAKLGAVHGFAGPIGGMYPAPHGAICAKLLPYVMEENVMALEKRNPSSSVINRYKEIAAIMTGKENATISDGIEWLYNLSSELHIPSLSDFGIKREGVPAIVIQAKKASSMKGNPIELSEDELGSILIKAI